MTYPGGYVENPPLAPGKFDGVKSMEQAWRIFAERPISWIVPAVLAFAVFLVGFLSTYIFLVADMLLHQSEWAEGSEQIPWLYLSSLVVVLVVFLVVWTIVATSFYRESVLAVQGKRPEIRDFFKLDRLGMMIAVAIVAGLLSLLGLLAFVVGSIVVGFFLTFVYVAAMVPGMTVGQALKESFQVVKNNVGHTLLLFGVNIVLQWLANFTGVGYVFVFPFMTLTFAHAFLTATGRPTCYRPGPQTR